MVNRNFAKLREGRLRNVSNWSLCSVCIILVLFSLAGCQRNQVKTNDAVQEASDAVDKTISCHSIQFESYTDIQVQDSSNYQTASGFYVANGDIKEWYESIGFQNQDPTLFYAKKGDHFYQYNSAPSTVFSKGEWIEISPVTISKWIIFSFFYEIANR